MIITNRLISFIALRSSPTEPFGSKKCNPLNNAIVLHQSDRVQCGVITPSIDDYPSKHKILYFKIYANFCPYLILSQNDDLRVANVGPKS